MKKNIRSWFLKHAMLLRHRRCMGVVALLAAWLIGHPFGWAGDVWTQAAPGIRYLHRSTSEPKEIHALVVDLTWSGLRVRATKPDEKGLTPGAFAQRVGAVAAVNGDFFDGTLKPIGLAVGDGIAWSGSADTDSWSFLACGRTAVCEIDMSGKTIAKKAEWTEVVGGNLVILNQGKLRTTAEDQQCGSFCTTAHPRTAAGLSADGNTLYLVMVEGRRTPVLGMTLVALSRLMQELGAHNALNLDGGGSSGMILNGKLANQRPSNEPSERKVANHIGILLDPTQKLDASAMSLQSDAQKAEQPDTFLACPSQQVSVSWKVQNTGTYAWQDAGVTRPGMALRLAHQSGERFGLDPQISLQQASLSQVAVGQDTTFSLVFSAPAQPGVYESVWQLVGDGKRPFGPKLRFVVLIPDDKQPIPCVTALKGPCAQGTWRCGGQGLRCEPLTPPQPERCDKIDNDCNGQVDEDDVCNEEPNAAEATKEDAVEEISSEPASESLPPKEQTAEGGEIVSLEGDQSGDGGVLFLERDISPSGCGCSGSDLSDRSGVWWCFLLGLWVFGWRFLAKKQHPSARMLS